MVLERAEYAASAFQLPAAAVQAARVQVEELQQLLAASRVPRIQFEKVGAVIGQQSQGHVMILSL